MKLGTKINKRKYIDAALLVIMFLLIFLVVKGRDELFMKKQYEFSTVNAAFYGLNGEKYVIDQGTQVINIVSRDHVLQKQLRGGSFDRFYYAKSVAADKNGVVYIADQAYDENGDEVNRVVQYINGKYRVLYSAYGRQIYEIQVYEDEVYFLSQDDFGLNLYKIDKSFNVDRIRQIYTGDVLNGASIDLASGVVAIAVRRGDVRYMTEEKSVWTTLEKDAEHLMPQDVSARGGRVFFSDIYAGRICLFAPDGSNKYETVFSDDGVKLVYINASADGQSLMCSDYSSYYELTYDGSGNLSSYYEGTIPYRNYGKTVFLWIMLSLSLVILLWLLRFIPGKALNLLHNESALRMVAVIIAVLSVSSFIAWSLLTESYNSEDSEDISSMKLFTDMVVENIDTKLLKSIEWETDYQGSAYMKLRDQLDVLMAQAYNEGKDFYYVFYGVSDGRLKYLMNYYDSCTCGEPYGTMDDSYYMDVYNTGKSYALKSRDADGLWLYILRPVENEYGERIAVLEIGTDLSYRMVERRNRTVNLLLDLFCSTAVVVMLIVEVLFMMSFFDKHRGEKASERKVGNAVPLRTVALLTYAASTLQDSFITTLSSKLYTGNLPVSTGIAVGLPLSAELLMMAVFAAIGGRMSSKFGSKKTLFIGVFIEISGFIVCAVMCNYTGLLIGNTLVGIGMGIINVTCNTLAAMGDGIEDTAAAFADIMAGSASGLTVGAGLAALMYPMGGARLSYAVAACFMIPAFFLVYSSVNVDLSETKAEEEETETKIGFVRFFFNLRVFGFLALILLPFMTSVSYREYFLPMYVMENGIAENRVGQIYLICGLLVLYVGPYISSYVIKKFGTFWSIIIASIMMGSNMLMFVLHPSMGTAVAGIFVLSAVTSFAYTCQYTFFEQLPDSLLYGDGRSMGVYSIFENLGQTVGPVVYGALLGFGYRTGLGIMGGALLVFAFCYTVFMSIKRERKFFR